MRRHLLLTLFTVTTLAACGGGGDGGNEPANNDAPILNDGTPPEAAQEPVSDDPQTTETPVDTDSPQAVTPSPEPAPEPSPESPAPPAPEAESPGESEVEPEPAVETDVEAESEPESEPESQPESAPEPVEDVETDPAATPPGQPDPSEDTDNPESAPPEQDTDLSFQDAREIVSAFLVDTGADFILGLNTRYFAGIPTVEDRACVDADTFNEPVVSIVCSEGGELTQDGTGWVHTVFAEDTDFCRTDLLNGTFDNCELISIEFEYRSTGFFLNWDRSAGATINCGFDVPAEDRIECEERTESEWMALMIEHALLIQEL